MNTLPDPRLPDYPVLKLASRYRRSLPLAAALATLLLGAWATARTQAIDFLLIGALAAVVVHFVTRGVLELVELVTELLIPQ